jgi:hypothetical protein
MHTATGSTSSSVDVKDGADTASVNSVLYGALNVLLLEAPSILKKKPADVDLRIKQLADLLEHCGDSKYCSTAPAPSPAAEQSLNNPQGESISSSASASALASRANAKLLAVRVPRLLVESKVERIVFRSQLLLYYQTHPRCQDQEPNSLSPVMKIKSKKNLLKKAAVVTLNNAEECTFFESVLSKCPEILAGPSSTLARLFFAASYLSKPRESLSLALTSKAVRRVTHLSVQHVEELLNCNTKNFLLCLSELGEEESVALDSEYAEYLKELIQELTPVLPLSKAQQQLATPLSLSEQLPHPVQAPSRDTSVGDLGGRLQSGVSEVDSDEDSNQRTARSGGSSSSSSSSSNGSLVSGDLGSSELERVLCGIFNDLTAAAVMTGDVTTSTEGQRLGHHVPKDSVGNNNNDNNNNNNVASTGCKDVISMKMEMQRLHGICETIGSVLVKRAK